MLRALPFQLTPGRRGGEERLIHYTAHRVDGPGRIDGDLDKEPWRSAARSSRFVDLVTGAPALLDT